MKKIYVSDLDGTFLRDDAVLSPFSRRTLSEMLNAHLLFTVASARSASSIRRVLAGLELNLPVIWHAGRAGVGSKTSWKYAEMKGYVEPLKSFPKVRFIFGHSGNRDWKEALEIAVENRNVWCDTHGLGIPALREFIDRVGPERLFFGSDWPFYHIAASMAKALYVTEGDRKVRNLLLRDNAENFLNG